MSGISGTAAKFLAILTLFAVVPGPRAAQAMPAQSAEAARSSALTVASNSADAAGISVPRLIQFNGTLKDAAARPVAGVASVTFAIYAEQDGGTALWSETQNVLADGNGHYNVLLGAATSTGVPAELFGTGQSRWLGITIARQPEMPRVLLASVPYALKAGDADTLGGLPASAYVTTQSLAARSTTPGSTTILTAGQNSAAGSQAAAPAALPVSNATPTGSGTADYIPLWTSASALGNSILYQTGGSIGIGTTTPAETLDVNGNSIFRGSFQLPPGHPATASSGYESHSFQFQASSFNSSTNTSNTEAFGFRAEPLNNNTKNPSAKLDLFFGAGGSAPFTDTGLSFAANGIITFAPGQSFNGVSETLTGSLNLPATSGTSTGVISLGGAPYIGAYGNSSNNNFIGQQAGISANQFGSNDNGFGAFALQSMTGAVNDIAIGGESLASATTGSFNVAIGTANLSSLSTGRLNTSVGDEAGETITTGSSNTLIGSAADVADGTLTNATAIGASAVAGASNAMVLGGTGANAVSVGIGTTTPGSMLELVSPNSDSTLGVPPTPILTLTNTAGGAEAKAAIDFNTSAPVYGANYNPGARILAFDEGGFTDSIVFQANATGHVNQGLNDTMIVAPTGNVEVFGNLTVDGTLFKSAGSFRIDDPIAPAEKYLSHSFVESPDMMNIYNGNVVTNAKGYAVVTMPPWFEALNGDFRYQLTTVGSLSQATVAREIKDGKFVIRSSRPHTKISWQVTGIRHDAWAQAHRIPVEEEKPANEQGHYIHPELFGAPAEQGMSAHHPHPAADSSAAHPVAARSGAAAKAALPGTGN